MLCLAIMKAKVCCWNEVQIPKEISKVFNQYNSITILFANIYILIFIYIQYSMQFTYWRGYLIESHRAYFQNQTSSIILIYLVILMHDNIFSKSSIYVIYVHIFIYMLFSYIKVFGDFHNNYKSDKSLVYELQQHRNTIYNFIIK